jgi:hypothetical protein
VKQPGPSAGGTEATGAEQLEPSAVELPRHRRDSAHTRRAAVSATSEAPASWRSRAVWSAEEHWTLGPQLAVGAVPGSAQAEVRRRPRRGSIVGVASRVPAELSMWRPRPRAGRRARHRDPDGRDGVNARHCECRPGWRERAVAPCQYCAGDFAIEMSSSMRWRA